MPVRGWSWGRRPRCGRASATLARGVKMRWMFGLGLSMWTAGCVQAPPDPTEGVIDAFLEAHPSTSLAAACADGDTLLSWSVEAHPLIGRYDAKMYN